MASCEWLKWNVPLFPFFQLIKQVGKTDMISYCSGPSKPILSQRKKNNKQQTSKISPDLDSRLDIAIEIIQYWWQIDKFSPLSHLHDEIPYNQ